MRNLIQAFVAGIAGAVTVVVLIGATSIKTDGNVETDQQLVSNTQQTAPLVVQSATLVPNLNADWVDGFDSSAFALASKTYTMDDVDALLAASRDSRRAFYLTIAEYFGDEADGTDGNGAGVCASGFHFASLYEIHDVSNLRYATDTEGGSDVFRGDDSGQGPPSDSYGWVRTGYSGGSGSQGQANCHAWTSNSLGDFGTTVGLWPSWESSTGGGNPSVVIAPWDSSAAFCGFSERIWCVEDYPGAGGG